MDDIVKAALAKWPNVPHCHAWLALDARGQWFMRDDRVQARGPFPQVKGSRIEHEKLLAFIERNYLCDEAGGWFFQNGPQRVYVDLEAAPWVWRLSREGLLTSHTGLATSLGEAFVDEQGRLFIATPLGLGIVHTQDMHVAADWAERGILKPLDERRFEALPQAHGYCLKPRPQAQKQ